MSFNVSFLNLKTFNSAINRHVKDFSNRKLVLFIKKIAMDLLRGIVMRTPVDEGTAQNNWHINIGSVGNEVDENAGQSAEGTIVNRERQKIDVIKQLIDLKSVIYIYNNIPYIVFLEDGTSDQAPDGMIKVTLAEVASSFDSRINFTGYVKRIGA